MSSSMRSATALWTTSSSHLPRRDLPPVRNKPGQGGQVVSVAVVASGATARGERRSSARGVRHSEDEAFGRGFFDSLKQYGLGGVRPVISDHPTGLCPPVRPHYPSPQTARLCGDVRHIERPLRTYNSGNSSALREVDA